MSMTPAIHAELLNDIEAFQRAHNLPDATFGRRAIRDANLLKNLRDGRELRRATEAKVRDFMREYQPEAPPPFSPASHGTDQRHPAPTAAPLPKWGETRTYEHGSTPPCAASAARSDEKEAA